MPKKIDISPNEGLLILIQHYQKDKHSISSSKIQDLKRLYLVGVCNDADAVKMNNFLSNSCLEPYQISYKKETINNDVARRYFEIQLSYETLLHQLKWIQYIELENHFYALYDLALGRFDDQTQFKKLNPHEKTMILDARSTLSEFEQINAHNNEYSDAIALLKRNDMQCLSNNDKKKIILLLKIAYLGKLNTNIYPLPLDIYHQDFYTPIQRDPKPLPETSAKLKDSFAKEATYTKHHFKTLVHPFSNSISGTVLAQMRCLAELNGGRELFYKMPSDEQDIDGCSNCFVWVRDEHEPKVGKLHYFGLGEEPVHVKIENEALFDASLKTFTHEQHTPLLFLNDTKLRQLINLCGGHMIEKPDLSQVSCNQNGEKFAQFIQLFTSSLLCLTGVHTLSELMEPLQIKCLRDAFSHIPDFDKKVNTESMFLTKNQEAFDKALQSTLSYHQTKLFQKSTGNLIEDNDQNDLGFRF